MRSLNRFAPLLGAALAATMGQAAQAQSLDPAGSNVIIGALSWVQGTLMGTVATVAAVIAIAAVGFMMLTGRLNWRYGATVILGCFILFGAGAIVAGIRQTAGGL
jgi:type IV secretion system protein VirB2